MADTALTSTPDWRQGSFFRKSDHTTIQEAASGLTLAASSRCLVISQDCDLLHHCFDSEPNVEVLVVDEIDSINGQYTYGKNPRYLDFSTTIEGNLTSFHIHAAKKINVPRRILCSCTPDSSASLGNTRELDTLTEWLGDRYTRVAFPDSFNERIINSESKKIVRALQSGGTNISCIYLALDPWGELPDTVPDAYRVVIIATMQVNDYDQEPLREVADAAIQRVSQALNRCPGIEVEESALLSEEKLTLNDIRGLHKWSYGYLSHRDETSVFSPEKAG